MKKIPLLLIFLITFLTAYSQEDCKCKKWEKQYTYYDSNYNQYETRYDYYTGCYPGIGYKDLGYDYAYCKKLAAEAKKLAEDTRLFEINKKKNKTYQGYKVIDWWAYSAAPPSLGIKGNNKRYWSLFGVIAITGDEINNKKEGVWYYAMGSGGLDDADLKILNQSNNLWVYYRNDAVIDYDTLKFTKKERDDKIALENERIALEKIKIQNDRIIDDFKFKYANVVGDLKQFNFSKYIFKTAVNSDRNSIRANVGSDDKVALPFGHYTHFDQKFQSKEELIKLLQTADKEFNSAYTTFANSVLPSPVPKEDTEYQIEKIKSYLDSLYNIDNITFDLEKLYPKIYSSINEQLYKTIKSSISETCLIKLNVIVTTKSDGKVNISCENISSDNKFQLNEVINRINNSTSIMPIYYMGTVINSKAVFKFDIYANTSSVKFVVVNSNKIKMNGWNGDEDNLPRKSNQIDIYSSIYTESHSLSDQYKSGLKFLKGKPNGVYAVSFTDFNINRKDNHIDYLSRYRSFGGPANCLYSVLIPGLGDMTISRGRDGWGKLFGVIACGVSAYYLNDIKNTNYEKYKVALEQEEIDKYYDNASLANVGAWSMAVIGAYVWLLDISEVYNKGAINKANERDFKKQEGVFKMGISMSSINQNMYPVLGLRYNLK
jgi:hypothetical protein